MPAPVPEFQTVLLREKFVLREAGDQAATAPPVIALSNRMTVPLPLSAAETPETLIVRTQNMHSCVRLAARLVQAAESGPVAGRVPAFNWSDAWENVIEGYEKKYNQKLWSAVYHDGAPLFAYGERHPFLDVIETCDFKTKADYKSSVALAESAFRKAGKEVQIEHDSNIALVLHINQDQGRVGVILRGAAQTATFNFTARKVRGMPVKISPCMTVAAAFLEGIQLAFQVGMARVKLKYGMIDADSDEARRLNDGEKRMARLKVAVSQFEQMADLTYRPERPDFFTMMDEAQEEAKKILKPHLEELIRQGLIAGEDWVL